MKVPFCSPATVRSVLVALSLVLAGCQSERETRVTPGRELLGVWLMQETTLSAPEACQKLRFEFRQDGTLIVNDGRLEETKRWAATRTGNGLLVTFTYVSNNGRDNCQGIPAEFVRANSLSRAYLELDDRQQLLRLYLGRQRTSDYVSFKRAGASDEPFEIEANAAGPDRDF